MIISYIYVLGFQLILNPIRDWNKIPDRQALGKIVFQLILNPIRDWNSAKADKDCLKQGFQLILNPIRDWNYWGGGNGMY